MPEETKTTAAAGADAPADKAAEIEPSQELMWVIGTAAVAPDGGSPLGLFERHPDHPGGEAYVDSNTAKQVAATSAVQAKINSKELRKASPEEVKSAKARAKEADDAAAANR